MTGQRPEAYVAMTVSGRSQRDSPRAKSEVNSCPISWEKPPSGSSANAISI